MKDICVHLTCIEIVPSRLILKKRKETNFSPSSISFSPSIQRN
jgi:hypothetical protein